MPMHGLKKVSQFIQISQMGHTHTDAVSYPVFGGISFDKFRYILQTDVRCGIMQIQLTFITDSCLIGSFLQVAETLVSDILNICSSVTSSGFPRCLLSVSERQCKTSSLDSFLAILTLHSWNAPCCFFFPTVKTGQTKEKI